MKRQTYTQHKSYELSDGKRVTNSRCCIYMSKYRKGEGTNKNINCKSVLFSYVKQKILGETSPKQHYHSCTKYIF